MLEIRPMQDSDLEYVRANPLEDAVKTYPALKPTEPAFTAVLDDTIVGVGGMIILWPGVGHLWLILTRDSKRDGFFGLLALSAIDRKIMELIRQYDIRRVEATVRADFPIAKKMIEAMGFTCEGTMRKYCPDGCDMYMYARIADGTI